MLINIMTVFEISYKLIIVFFPYIRAYIWARIEASRPPGPGRWTAIHILNSSNAVLDHYVN